MIHQSLQPLNKTLKSTVKIFKNIIQDFHHFSEDSYFVPSAFENLFIVYKYLINLNKVRISLCIVQNILMMSSQGMIFVPIKFSCLQKHETENNMKGDTLDH